jgi:hypothetical protein
LDLESSVQLKEDRTIFDMDDKSSIPEGTSTSHYRDKKVSGAKQKALNAISGVDDTTSKKSKLGRDSAVDVNVTFETKEQLRPADKAWKRKRKPMVSKVT